MNYQQVKKQSLHHTRGFTLMELMVSVTILVLVILSVGVIFQSTTHAVGVSQASSEMLSNVGAVQQQLERDLSGLNKNGFLVIRCGTFTDVTVTPNVTRRCDQLSFLSTGSFPNRTGTTDPTTPFINNTIAPSALVWWGQLAIESTTGANTTPTIATNYCSNNPSTPILINQVPTGKLETDFTLGRNTILLMPATSTASNVLISTSPAPAISLPAYQSTAALAAVDIGIGTIQYQSEPAADITQSRFSVAAITPSQLMGYVMRAVPPTNPPTQRPAATTRFEADHYCYRYGALRSPYDIMSTETFFTGYFRMHPIALQGVPSFAVDWTDGSSYAGNEIDVVTGITVTPALTGTTKWYGINSSANGTITGWLSKSGTPFVDGFVDHGSNGVVASSNASGDHYAAVFSYDNTSKWPVALRFRYHVADPTGRLPGGRDFVQVVKLP